MYSWAVEGCWLDCFVPFTSQGPVWVIGMKGPLLSCQKKMCFFDYQQEKLKANAERRISLGLRWSEEQELRELIFESG